MRERTSLSTATIYRWMGDGRFPSSVKLTETSVRWNEGDIEAWIRAQRRVTRPQLQTEALASS